MKQGQKIISLLLMMAMLFSCFSPIAAAVDSSPVLEQTKQQQEKNYLS